MKKRFEFLFRDSSELYAEGCPLVLVGRALLRDLEKNHILAQLTFRSAADKPIKEVVAAVRYETHYGKPLGSVNVKYKNLSCHCDEFFGTDVPVLIPDPNARRFSVIFASVTFEDDSVWSGPVSMAAKASPKPAAAQTAPVRPAAMGEQDAREAAERRKQQAQEAAARKEQQEREAAARREQLAQEAAVRKERLVQEAAAKKELLEKAAAAKKAETQTKNFEKAKSLLEQGKSAKELRKAEALFIALGDYEDCAAQLDACHSKLKELAVQKLEQPKSPKELKEAEEIFRSLGDDEELTALIEHCKEQQVLLTEQKGTKTKKIVTRIAVAIVVIAIAVAAVPVGKTYIIPAVKYAQAEKLAKDGSYDEAISIFSELGEYKDAQERTWQTAYDKGMYLMEHCDYPAASSMFASLHGFADARERVKEAEYLYGEELMREHKYPEAVAALLAAEDFADAPSLIDECYLQWAEEEYKATNYETCVDLLRRISNLNNIIVSPETEAELDHNIQMEMAAEAGELAMPEEEVSEEPKVTENNGYPAFYNDAMYQLALIYFEEGKLTDAINLLGEIPNYEDSMDMRMEAMYLYVTEHGSNTDQYTNAYLKELVEANYADSQKLAETIYAWSVEIVANNSATSKKNQATVTGTRTCYFHFTLKGGHPDETIPVYVRVKYPGGNSDKADFPTMKHDQSEYFYFNSWGNYPKGNCTITVYNGNTNKVIGTHTVKIT